MYFATTDVKDIIAETVIRKRNIEHLKQGLFEVHLYLWEEIVDLIFKNKATYDYLDRIEVKATDSGKIEPPEKWF